MGWWLVMAFIWENYAYFKRYIVGEKISPYMEVFSDNESVISVNPLIRFSELYCMLESVDCSNLKMDSFQNVLFHYLVSLDLLKGFDQRQIGIDYLRQEIQNGYWGALAENNWKQLNEKHQEVLLHSLYMKLINDSPDDYFFMTVQRLFSVVSLIYEKSANQYYLYIGERKTEYNQILINFVIGFFWSIQKDIEIVWEKHYGIIGSDNTMKISEILIV